VLTAPALRRLTFANLKSRQGIAERALVVAMV